MRPLAALRIGRAWITIALGTMLVMLGSGVSVAALGVTGTAATASAATAQTSPVPVLEQNLNGAGRIRVALPNGAAPSALVGPWFWTCCWQWYHVMHANGPGEFTGLTADACGGCTGNGWPDFQIWINMDGQWFLHDTWASWASNWLQNEGEVMGGTVNWLCGNCITWHFFPPTGPVAFNSNLDVYLNDCCNWNIFWVDVFYTTGNSAY